MKLTKQIMDRAADAATHAGYHGNHSSMSILAGDIASDLGLDWDMTERQEVRFDNHVAKHYRAARDNRLALDR